MRALGDGRLVFQMLCKVRKYLVSSLAIRRKTRSTLMISAAVANA